MGVFEDIINSGNQPVNNGQQSPRIQQQSETKVNDGSNKQPVQQQTVQQTETETQQQVNAQPKMSYVEMFHQMNPYKPPTQEELEKERKKQKREAIFAAIGDGISSLSNLFFTTQGAPNAYDPSLSLSAAYKKRYDKLKSERDSKNKEYMNGYMRALQADDTKDRAERNWRHQLEREAVSDGRYKSEQERNERRYQEQKQKDEERWKKNFEAQQEQRKKSNDLAWANHNLSKKSQEDNKALRELQIKTQGAKAVRGKRIGFSDGAGNEIGIYENVWKGSMQQVFDAITADLRPNGDVEGRAWDRKMKKMNAKQKDDFVKQNWTKSQKASAIMLTLSKIDPASMTSEIKGDEEDFSEYKEDEEEDFSQYKD